MPIMRIIERTANQWGVPLHMPGLLHTPGNECVPGQAPGLCAVGGDRAFPREPWPGARVGVRAPGIDETPIGYDEVAHGVREGLFA